MVSPKHCRRLSDGILSKTTRSISEKAEDVRKVVINVKLNNTQMIIEGSLAAGAPIVKIRYIQSICVSTSLFI